MPPQEIMAAWHGLLAGRVELRGSLLEHFLPILVNSVWLNPTYLTVQEDIVDIKRSAALDALENVFNNPTMVRFKAQEPEPQYRELRAYLRSAAQNRALSRLSRRERSPDHRRDAIETTSRQTEDYYAELHLQLDRLQWLQSTIESELSAEQVLVVLFRLDERPYKEIAALLDIPESAAQDRHRRAMKKLRALAGRHGRLHG